MLCAGCLAALLAIAGCAPRSNQEPQPPRLDIKREIEDLLADPGNPLGIADTTGIAALKPRLVKFYADRHHHPIWSNGKRPSSRARTLLLAIPQAEALGLDPARFEQQHLERLAAQAERSSAPAQRLRERTLARFDVLASIATWRLACEIREGWVPAAALDPDWTKVRPTLDPTKDLKRVLTSDPSRTFAECEPHSEGYRRLRDMLARYRMIAHEGGWSPIPAGPPLQLGARGPRVAALLRSVESHRRPGRRVPRHGLRLARRAGGRRFPDAARHPAQRNAGRRHARRAQRAGRAPHPPDAAQPRALALASRHARQGSSRGQHPGVPPRAGAQRHDRARHAGSRGQEREPHARLPARASATSRSTRPGPCHPAW